MMMMIIIITRTITVNLRQNLEALPGEHSTVSLQKTAVLAT
jgi:hypothetical protein